MQRQTVWISGMLTVLLAVTWLVFTTSRAPEEPEWFEDPRPAIEGVAADRESSPAEPGSTHEDTASLTEYLEPPSRDSSSADDSQRKRRNSRSPRERRLAPPYVDTNAIIAKQFFEYEARVVDARGRPVADTGFQIHTVLADNSLQGASALSDEAGRVRLRVPLGDRYKLRVAPSPDSLYLEDTWEETSADHFPTTVRLSVGSQLHLKIEPPQEIMVSMITLSLEPGDNRSADVVDGVAQFDNLPPGTYDASVSAAGIPRQSLQLDLPRDGRVSAWVRFPEPRALTVEVRNPDGKVIPDAKLSIDRLGARTHTVSANGTVPLYANSKIQAYSEKHAFSESRIVTESNFDRGSLVFELEPLTPVTVQVRNFHPATVRVSWRRMASDSSKKVPQSPWDPWSQDRGKLKQKNGQHEGYLLPGVYEFEVEHVVADESQPLRRISTHTIDKGKAAHLELLLD